jgi:hypothetical protein
MYSNFDFEKQLLMVGFTPERLAKIIAILYEFVDSSPVLVEEAQEILTFLQASKLAIVS